MKVHEPIFFFLLLFVLNTSATGEEKNIRYKVVLTNSLEEKVQVKEFGCQEKIFLYFTWFGLIKGSHNLRAFWHKPGGKLQETTEYNFSASIENGREFKTWLWLKLEKGRERAAFSPEIGWSDFIGQWSVEIFLDGEFIAKKNFHVTC